MFDCKGTFSAGKLYDVAGYFGCGNLKKSFRFEGKSKVSIMEQ